MARLKTFFKYALIIVAFWIFSDIIIYLSVNSAYTNIDSQVYTNSPEIIVGESKATYINGFVKGIIKNNTNEIINDKYLKIDLYSARDINLGTKYIKIENLQVNESQNFEMWYKFTDVDYATFIVTDNIENSTQEEFISQETAGYLIIGTLLVLYFI